MSHLLFDILKHDIIADRPPRVLIEEPRGDLACKAFDDESGIEAFGYLDNEIDIGGLIEKVEVGGMLGEVLNHRRAFNNL